MRAFEKKLLAGKCILIHTPARKGTNQGEDEPGTSTASAPKKKVL